MLIVVEKNIWYLNLIEYNVLYLFVKLVKQENFLHSIHQYVCLKIDDIVINIFDQIFLHHDENHLIEYEKFFVFAKTKHTKISNRKRY